MTVLIGGLRAININTGGATHGKRTERPGVAVQRDVFVNLLDMDVGVAATSDAKDVFEGRDRKEREAKWTGTRVDPVFGLQRRAARAGRGLCRGRRRREVRPDFVAASTMVMELDRFDLHG